LVASLDDLRAAGRAVIDPRDCGLYLPATYESEHLTPFDPGRPVPWVHGYSLRDRQPVLVARRNVFYGADDGGDNFVNECSSGCASGGSLPEAILFGLLEVIERDAFLLGWYGRADLPGIAVDGETGSLARLLVDRAALLGYQVDLLDNRIDLDVPVVTAVARRRDGGDGALVLASAASLDPGQAVEGALSEILTYLPSRAAQVEARRGDLERMAGDFHQVRQLRDHAELFGLPSMAEHATGYLGEAGARPLGPAFAARLERRPPHLDLMKDVEGLVADLSAIGHDVVVVDQTSPEQAASGLFTVRVIVPGLLPIDFGWSRQRALLMPRLDDAFARPGAVGRRPGGVRRVPHPFP
jgi:ribosomal protein S12 methylthiotransferase accessory factor